MNKALHEKNIRVSALYISLVMALIPLFNYSISGRGLFLYLGVGMIIAFPFLGTHRYITDLTGLYILFAIFELCSFLWAPSSGDRDWFQYLKIIIYVIIIITTTFSENETKVILFGQIVMGIIVTFVLATTSNTMIYQGAYLTDTNRAILKIGDVQLDPNYTCMLFFPAVMFAWITLFSECKARYRILSTLYILIALYACLRTGSRGGIYAIVVGLFYYFAINRGSSFKKITIIILTIICVIYIFPYFLSYLPDSVAKRFSLAKVFTSGGAGRQNYWEQCLSHVGDSFRTLLIGHGKGATFALLGMNSHNFFIDTLYNGGIIELVLLVLFILKIFKRLNARKNTYAKALFICYLMMSFTVSVGTSIFFWTGILIVIQLSYFGNLNSIKFEKTKSL